MTRNKFKVSTQVDVPEELLGDILVTAFDGGCGGCWFWATPARVSPTAPMTSPALRWIDLGNGRTRWTSYTICKIDECLKDDGYIDPVKVSNAQHFVVDYEILVLGIQRILNLADSGKGYGGGTGDAVRQSLFDGDAGEIDANVADSIVQQGLFLDEIYG